MISTGENLAKRCDYFSYFLKTIRRFGVIL